ncbi:Tubulinyl-Tyr carboxypeptidase 2 [Geranomyces variabilis]|uniref:Tubulinyl-Tyr carboxypeptidase 2 n=1 Tax=Geranomyces variabilis TaxID=109894 RepID=A0AAD5XPL0_9FUNG|nr:Tubulinyl-Tyr carboxypeptidase 2 [Geranomyces variabilis]
MDDQPHPESFTPEKWTTLLAACSSRIQMSGGLPAVLRSMDLNIAGDENTNGDLHAAVKALVRDAGGVGGVSGGGVSVVPRLPSFGGGVLAGAAIGERVQAVRTTFFEIRKTASVRSLMRTAQEMVSFALPIKCLEAVVLATYLTAPLVEVERIHGHRLRKIKLGLPITHDTTSNERFTWKFLSLHVNTPLVADEGERMLDKYIRGLRGGFAPHI